MIGGDGGMKATDFEYDSLRLSDFGMILCKFDSSGMETITNGSEITFNTVSTMNGMKHQLASATYDDCLTFTLQICKNPCLHTNMEISLEDICNITRWLNRKSFHKFRLLDDEYAGIYFEASFNISKVEMNGKTVGLELEAFTNRPFAVREPVILTINNTDPSKTKAFFSKSDEAGYIYPNMEITINQAGNLEIYSITENRTMKINNCKAGEIITVEYPLITSSLSSHKIQNDFNWIFFRVATSFKNKENEFTVSLPCTIKIEYSPIVKVGI